MSRSVITSYSIHYTKLYDTLANWRGIHDQIAAAYQRHGERAWQREIIRRAGVHYQVQICQLGYLTDHWASLPPAERKAQQAFLFPSLVPVKFLDLGVVGDLPLLRRPGRARGHPREKREGER